MAIAFSPQAVLIQTLFAVAACTVSPTAIDSSAAARTQRIDQLLYDHARLEVRIRELEELEASEGLLAQHLPFANATESVPSLAKQAAYRRLGKADYSDEDLEAIAAKLALVTGSAEYTAAAAVLAEFFTKIGDLNTCLDYFWLIVCGALVMFMQAGFALLEAGSVRAKNAGMVFLKNIADVCLGTICWYFLGYGFAYGKPDDPGEFIGTQQFFGDGFLETDANDALVGTSHYKDWFFQWTFCATAATIVSGSVAERIRFPTYVAYSVFMTVWIYPVIVYWTWSGSGWLSLEGYDDFAGSGIVHMVGGYSALTAAYLLGPRTGRWQTPERFAPHNMGLVVLGTFSLWFGWYGFNCGSTLAFSDVGTATKAGLVAMNTTLSAATGGLTVFLLRMRNRTYDLAGMCNGILAGLVAVCAGVDNYDPGMSLLVGVLGGCAYETGHCIVLSCGIDDPLDAFAVHGCGGMAGVLARPLLDRTGAKGPMFEWHFLGLLSIASWSAGLTLLFFLPFKLAGLLRADEEEEIHGGDSLLTPNRAYTLDGQGEPFSPGKEDSEDPASPKKMYTEDARFLAERPPTRDFVETDDFPLALESVARSIKATKYGAASDGILQETM